MEQVIEDPHIIPIELSKQAPDDGKACTAYSFINALKLLGTPPSPQEEEGLVRKAQETPLENPERMRVANELGIQYKNLSGQLLEIPKTPGAIFELLSNSIHEGPVVFAVSRFFGKRPETYRENKKNSFHAVTAHEKDGKIETVDPYDPEKPEVFDPAVPEARQRFLAWFISPYIQFTGTSDLETTLRTSLEVQSSEQNFGNAIRGVASLHQAYALEGQTT